MPSRFWGYPPARQRPGAKPGSALLAPRHLKGRCCGGGIIRTGCNEAPCRDIVAHRKVYRAWRAIAVLLVSACAPSAAGSGIVPARRRSASGAGGPTADGTRQPESVAPIQTAAAKSNSGSDLSGEATRTTPAGRLLPLAFVATHGVTGTGFGATLSASGRAAR
jgi:hypothetical protein